jgi:ABC-2 type transport system permease protein
MTALAIGARPSSGKYLAVAGIALRQRLSERASLLLRAFMHVAMLLVFSRVWAAVVPNPGNYVWYLAVTEWVMLSQPRLFVVIERDVRSGDIASMLARPVSYVVIKIVETLGELIPSLCVLGVAGGVTAFLLSGGLPREPLGLLAALVLGVLGSLLWTLCSTLIGLSAFWLHDCTPVYYIWQKAAFVLGGMFVPLELYPSWLRSLALWSPFSALINGPASMVLHYDPLRALLLACKLLVYIALAAVVVRFTWSRAVRAIELGGG